MPVVVPTKNQAPVHIHLVVEMGPQLPSPIMACWPLDCWVFLLSREWSWLTDCFSQIPTGVRERASLSFISQLISPEMGKWETINWPRAPGMSCTLLHDSWFLLCSCHWCGCPEMPSLVPPPPTVPSVFTCVEVVRLAGQNHIQHAKHSIEDSQGL